MSHSTVRNILALVPEVVGLVKAAHLGNDFPVDTPEDAAMSAIRMTYLLKVAHEPVWQDDYDRVQTAVRLFGVGDLVKSAADKMLYHDFDRVGGDPQSRAEAAVVNALSVFNPDMNAIVKAAAYLVDEYGDGIKSADVRRLGGGDVFATPYAVAGLLHREAVCPGCGYADIATAPTKMASVDAEDGLAITEAVRKMDDLTGMRSLGCNFYEEAWISKAAAVSCMTVKLAGRDVAIEDVMRMPVDRILGADIGDAMHGHPAEAKAVLESLPLPQQQLLVSRMKV